ncbi:MAG: carbohydrate-binding domain-containing protein [Candidatus Bathyarchaeota archaeon]|nr:carbohydrate-binding domain-containing protein [Candidatus Termiticorpusculum sp.]
MRDMYCEIFGVDIMKKGYVVIVTLLIIAVTALLLVTYSNWDYIEDSLDNGGKPVVDDNTMPTTTDTISNDDTVIALNGDSTKVNGSGVSITNDVTTNTTTLLITEGGTYVVSGSISNGQIIVNAPKDNVVITLNGADITCSYSSPIYVYKSSLTTIYLPSGTVNTLTDGTTYTFADNLSSAIDDEPNACLYSGSDLVISGNGKLVVNANYKNGITSKDTLEISSATIIVTAKNNGVNGRNSNVITNADITVNCGGDAIRSTHDVDSSLGYIVISNSKMYLTAGEDGIQAETSLTIKSGTFNIKTGGGSSARISSTISAKGLKASADIVINGGTFIIDSADDGIHSNGDITIFDGVFTISTGDDGAHADKNLNVTGGTINIAKSYEGLEGSTVNISGGTINIVASDDGINAAGGSSRGAGGGPGRFGADRFTGSGDYAINVSGGTIVLYAGGDGLDSNGVISIIGGKITAIINSSLDNSALDCDGGLTITGGTVIAGGTGTFESLTSSSTQSYVYLSNISSGAQIVVQSGTNRLAEYTSNRELSRLVIFAPGITNGQSYTVSVNGVSSSVTAGTGGGGQGGFGNMGGRR